MAQTLGSPWRLGGWEARRARFGTPWSAWTRPRRSGWSRNDEKCKVQTGSLSGKWKFRKNPLAEHVGFYDKQIDDEERGVANSAPPALGKKKTGGFKKASAVKKKKKEEEESEESEFGSGSSSSEEEVEFSDSD